MSSETDPRQDNYSPEHVLNLLIERLNESVVEVGDASKKHKAFKDANPDLAEIDPAIIFRDGELTGRRHELAITRALVDRLKAELGATALGIHGVSMEPIGDPEIPGPEQ